MTNNIQGNSHQAISWFLNRNSTSQKGMECYFLSDEREKPTTKNTLSSKTLLQIWWNQKLSRQAKVKRIQHHQTSFTTNAKEMSLCWKHKTKKRPTENKPKTRKHHRIIHINHYLKCKWIKRTNQRHRLAKWMTTCACMHFHLPHHSGWPHCLAIDCENW